MNTASLARLEKVHPLLAQRVLNLDASIIGEHFTIEVVQGLRTIEEQNKLFAQGRTSPGKIVTRARGGQSNHNYGLAVDLCPFVGSKPAWDFRGGFIAIGRAAEAVGLAWGGDWPKFLDLPHVELPGLTIKRCQALYYKGGLKAVWAEASKLNV